MGVPRTHGEGRTVPDEVRLRLRRAMTELGTLSATEERLHISTGTIHTVLSPYGRIRPTTLRRLIDSLNAFEAGD